MAKSNSDAAIFEMVEKVYMDTDASESHTQRVVLVRHAVHRKGPTPQKMPVDQYLGKRTYVFGNEAIGKHAQELSCMISPVNGVVVVKDFAEALDPEVFDAAMKPVYQRAEQEIMHALAQRHAQQQQQNAVNPNRLLTPADGAVFQQTAAVAKAAESRTPGQKLVIAAR